MLEELQHHVQGIYSKQTQLLELQYNLKLDKKWVESFVGTNYDSLMGELRRKNIRGNDAYNNVATDILTKTPDATRTEVTYSCSIIHTCTLSNYYLFDFFSTLFVG